ncbi:MAG TPA: hypothetical protein ENJ93_01655 [Chloroflexi bacterium]|nr:hypothetical protein [Chloroflexota bacterium]
MKNKPILVDRGPALAQTGLVHRALRPDTAGPHPTAVLLHGYWGNEDAMWVFARTLPPHWLIVAPRGIAQEGDGRYSWQPRAPQEWPTLEQFDTAVSAITHFIHTLPALYNADLRRIHMMGFSQGAAAALATAVHQPGWIQAVASLVGFMPAPTQRTLSPNILQDLSVFMAAGTRDERVPLAIAHASAQAVQAAGASLTYKEYDVGHKLNAQGMRDLKKWWGSLPANASLST